MSRANIFSQKWVKLGYVVTFLCNHGSDYRSYLYPHVAGVAIEAGADPANYPGEQIEPGEMDLSEGSNELGNQPLSQAVKDALNGIQTELAGDAAAVEGAVEIAAEGTVGLL